jgi:hypothetical protein
MMKRKPYCPYNGCGMINGAAPPHIIHCKHCGFENISSYKYGSQPKICPICNHCISCGRLAKKFYKNDKT